MNDDVIFVMHSVRFTTQFFDKVAGSNSDRKARCLLD